MICTNGSLWTDENMRGLAHDGLASVIMSIDAHDGARHERNRGLPDVCRKIKHANEVFAQLGIQTTASVTASKLVEDYAKLPAFLTELGFRSCTFSYPLSSLASTYLSFSDSSLVSYRTDEVIARRVQRFDLDYDLDPEAGAILFRGPVAPFDRDLNPIRVVVLYEARGEGSDQLTAGARLGLRPHDRPTWPNLRLLLCTRIPSTRYAVFIRTIICYREYNGRRFGIGMGN